MKRMAVVRRGETPAERALFGELREPAHPDVAATGGVL